MTSDIANEGGPPHEAFGLRLTIAAIARFSALGSFRAQLIGRPGLSKATVYRHAAGERLPDKDEIITLYEKILRIPPGWLLAGAGESVADLREAEAAIKAKDRANPALQKILAYLDTDENRGNVVPINQLERAPQLTYGKFAQIRHIPVLTAGEIIDLMAGRRTIDEMSIQRFIPVVADTDLGPRSIAHVVRADDFSMTSAGGYSIPPNTELIIDRDREIQPGDFILVRHRSEDEFMVRRYKASQRHGVATRFTLEALNPSFEPIRVDDPSEYEIAGRLVRKLERM